MDVADAALRGIFDEHRWALDAVVHGAAVRRRTVPDEVRVVELLLDRGQAAVPFGTDRIEDAPDAVLESFDAFWCVPASPDRSTSGALRALRYAREPSCPILPGATSERGLPVLRFALSALLFVAIPASAQGVGGYPSAIERAMRCVHSAMTADLPMRLACTTPVSTCSW